MTARSRHLIAVAALARAAMAASDSWPGQADWNLVRKDDLIARVGRITPQDNCELGQRGLRFKRYT